MATVLSDTSYLGLLASIELEFLSMTRSLDRLDSTTVTMTPTPQTNTWGLALCPAARIYDAEWPHVILSHDLPPPWHGAPHRKGRREKPTVDTTQASGEEVPVGP